MESNHDLQVQSLVSCRLDDPAREHPGAGLSPAPRPPKGMRVQGPLDSGLGANAASASRAKEPSTYRYAREVRVYSRAGTNPPYGGSNPPGPKRGGALSCVPIPLTKNQMSRNVSLLISTHGEFESIHVRGNIPLLRDPFVVGHHQEGLCAS